MFQKPEQEVLFLCLVLFHHGCIEPTNRLNKYLTVKLNISAKQIYNKMSF